MKKMIFITVVIMYSLSAALAAKCPVNTEKVMTCLSKPKVGDHEVASNMLDSITICNNKSEKNKLKLVVEKNNESDILSPVVELRVGSISYKMKAGEVDFTLSVTSGINPQIKNIPARFKISIKEPQIEGSSTYVCRR
jgi:hypothetical protein